MQFNMPAPHFFNISEKERGYFSVSIDKRALLL